MPTESRGDHSLTVFDPSITYESPIGSCLIRMLQPLIGQWRIHLVINETNLRHASLRKTKIVLPRRPVFLRTVLYTLLSTCAWFFALRRKRGLKMSSEGAFPFCDISYNHFCHRFFLSKYRQFLGGGVLRRIARLLTHEWGALTERIGLAHARVVVVPSTGLAREFESVYPNLVRGKLRVIPNPVDTDAFSRPPDFNRNELRNQLRISAGDFVLSFCALGNFERKGLRIVLNALRDVRGVHLLVVGGTEGEIREFSLASEQARVDAYVHFVGLQRDVKPYLWSSDAFVFPSIYEGFALVCLQAAAAGLPLIATPVSGIEEFIEDGVNGWKVERTSASVESAIRKAASDRQKSAEMGGAAKNSVQQYKQEFFQARWSQLLNELEP